MINFKSNKKSSKFILSSAILLITILNFGFISAVGCTLVSLDSPNGGEYLRGLKDITWTWNDDDMCSAEIAELDYSATGGAPWIQFGAASHPGDEIYSNWDTTSYVDGINYLIRARIAGSSNFSDAVFTIDNTDPVADLTNDEPYACNEGSSVTVDASSSTDNIGIATYNWDLDDDGSYDDASTIIPTTDFDCTLSEGNYNFGVEVVDRAGNTDTTSSSVAISNVAPIITIAQPNGGEYFGGNYNIEWTATDTFDTLTIDLEYWDNIAGSWVGIINDETNDGVYLWNTAALTDDTNFLVRATADDGTTTTSDNSDAVFTIDNTNPIVDAGVNDIINEDQTYILDGTGSSDNIDVALDYFWDFDEDGDYDDAIGDSPEFDPTIYTTNGLIDGVYTIGLKVSDDAGNFGTDSMDLTVNNIVPVVIVNYPNGAEQLYGTFDIEWTATDVMDDLTIDIEYSDDAGGSWNVLANSEDNDGAYSWDTTGLDDTDFLVRVTADDGTDSISDTSDATFELDSVPPIAEANGVYTCDEGSTTNMDSTGSNGATIGIDTIDWDLDNDGNYESPEPAVFSCNDDGVYDVEVQVTDLHGLTATNGSTVTVNNVAPVLVIGANINYDEGTEVTASASCTDAGTFDSHIADFDWGDGNSDNGIIVTCDGTPFSQTHTYIDNGVYTVTIDVTDDDTDSDSDVLTATISNVAPVVDAGIDQTIDEGDTLTLDSIFSDVGSIDTHTATIDWGDGSAVENVNPATSPITNTHIYTDDTEQPFTITLTVTDNDRDSSSDTLIVTVNNVAPTVIITSPTNGDSLMGTYTIQWDSVEVGTDWVTMDVDYNDGSGWTNTYSDNVLGTFDSSYSYDWDTTALADGTYDLRVVVTDDDGASNTFTILGIIIDNTAPNNQGPEVNPNPVMVNADATFTGTITDTNVLSDAQVHVLYDGTEIGLFSMSAADGAFDEISEDVSVTIPAATTTTWVAGIYVFWFEGQDQAGNGQGQTDANTDTFTVEATSIYYTRAEIEAMIDVLEVNISANTAAISALDGRLDIAENDIDANTADILINTRDINSLEGNVSVLQTDVTALTTRVTNSEDDIEDLQDEVSDIQDDITSINNNITTLNSSVTTLNTNVAANTASINTINGQITTLNTNVANNAVNITELRGLITGLTGDVSSLDARLDTAEGEIDTLQAGLINLQTEVTALSSNVSINSASIATLNTQVATLNNNLEGVQDNLDDMASDLDSLLSFVITDATDDNWDSLSGMLIIHPSLEASCTWTNELNSENGEFIEGDGTYSANVEVDEADDGKISLFTATCTVVSENYNFEYTKGKIIAFTVDTAGSYGYTEWLGPSTWDSFFLPKLILDDLLGIEDHPTSSVLSSLYDDDEEQYTYDVVWYYNGEDWVSYSPTAPEFMNDLNNFDDTENKPYWIKMNQKDRLEVGLVD